MAPEFIDIEKVCRLCLREDDGRCKMTSMYQQPELDYIIQKCVQIEVSDDSLCTRIGFNTWVGVQAAFILHSRKICSLLTFINVF